MPQTHLTPPSQGEKITVDADGSLRVPEHPIVPFISDACAAQVGGLGLAPGANIGDKVAVFEATHGTAPKYAGLDKVNPGSLILSGGMLLRHLGWGDAANLLEAALERSIAQKTVTYDLERQMQGATLTSCSGFAARIVANMDAVA